MGKGLIDASSIFRVFWLYGLTRLMVTLDKVECCEQTQFRKSGGVELHEIHIRKHISIAFSLIRLIE